MGAAATLINTSPFWGVGVGTVWISMVQSAAEVPFPGDVTTSRFISVGISSAMSILLFIEYVIQYEINLKHPRLMLIAYELWYEVLIISEHSSSTTTYCRT